jgi:hypothetical protein
MRISMAGMSLVLAAAAFPLVAGAADRDAMAQPAVAKAQPAAYIKDAVQPADIAQAGVGSLDAAVGTQISNRSSPSWLVLPSPIAAPDSSIAWICGVGFLGFVVVRRLNAAASY